MASFIRPPSSVPWLLRPLLWVARRITGKEPQPGLLLAHFPKGAVGAGLFEAMAAGKGDLDARCLAAARIVASVVAGCPFCLDMNAATWKRAGLSEDELGALVTLASGRWETLGPREFAAVCYAEALSRTPVELKPELLKNLTQAFTDREIVILATTIAQVNYWSRFCQGLGIPPAGFFDASSCSVQLPGRTLA